MNPQEPLRIKVYGKPNCQQCETTKLHLDRLKLPYQYLDITEDANAYDTVMLLGYQSAPVVTVGDIHWSGYRHDKIKELASIYSKAGDVTHLDGAAEQYLKDEAV